MSVRSPSDVKLATLSFMQAYRFLHPLYVHVQTAARATGIPVAITLTGIEINIRLSVQLSSGMVPRFASVAKLRYGGVPRQMKNKRFSVID
jgi:hypothetical protein